MTDTLENKNPHQLEINLKNLNDYWSQEHGGQEVCRVYMVRYNKNRQPEDFIDLPAGWKRVFIPGEKLLQVIDYYPGRIMLANTSREMYAVVRLVPNHILARTAKATAEDLGNGLFNMRGVVLDKRGNATEIWMVHGGEFGEWLHR